MLHRVFYGWYVVAAVLVITTAISGFFFYNLSILLAAFVAERGFPVALASSATATFFVAAGIGGMMAGRLVDRIDVRLVVTVGALLGTLALASVGALHATWQLFAFHIALGLAHGTSGLVPVTTVIARCTASMRRRRGWRLHSSWAWCRSRCWCCVRARRRWVWGPTA
jgi:MFS family permease